MHRDRIQRGEFSNNLTNYEVPQEAFSILPVADASYVFVPRSLHEVRGRKQQTKNLKFRNLDSERWIHAAVVLNGDAEG